MSAHRWVKDNDRNVQLYSELVRKHGNDVRALGWGSRASQAKRFEVLAEIGKLQGASVMDVGCGLGDFYAWMKKKRLRVRYTGVDITPGMVDRARKRFPGAQFQVQDLLDASRAAVPHDYVFSSGIFTHCGTSAFEFLAAMISRMFELSRQAVAFNSLSAWTKEEEQEAGEYYADPVKVVDYCRQLTPWVVLRHDYHPRDFTIYMYKTGRP